MTYGHALTCLLSLVHLPNTRCVTNVTMCDVTSFLALQWGPTTRLTAKVLYRHPNMVLGKEASIIADSTVSSSPPQAADASPQIRRAARTYGKRREEPLAVAAASTWYATPSSENIHKTAPPGLKETIPASSPAKMPMDLDAVMGDDELGRQHKAGQTEKDSNSLESDSHPEQEDPSPRFKSVWRGKQMEIDDSSPRSSFGWKEKMMKFDQTFEEDIPASTPTSCDPKLISEEGDFHSEQENSLPELLFGWKANPIEIGDDGIPESRSPSDKPKDSLSFGKAMLLQEANAGTIQPGSTGTCTTPPLSPSDVFNGSPSTLSRPDAPQSPFSLSSPPAPHRSRRPRRHVVCESDSEEERRKGSSSTAPSTSGHNSFVSVKSRSSSTQPTSDEEVPSKISVNPKLSLSWKPGSSRVSAPPINAQELSSKRGRKSKQTKLKVNPTRPTVKIR